MRQNIHALILNLPKNLQTLADSFHLSFRPERKGTLVSDAMAADETPVTGEVTFKADLEEETVELLGVWKSQQPELSKTDISRHGFFRRRFVHLGTDLMPEKCSFSNSLVVTGSPDDWRVAQIECIFDVIVYPRGEKRVYTLCKLRYFAELSGEDLRKDLYRRRAGVGRVFYMQSGAKDIVSANHILSHFCMTPDILPRVSKRHMHALPLFQVGPCPAFASRVNVKCQTLNVGQ